MLFASHVHRLWRADPPDLAGAWVSLPARLSSRADPDSWFVRWIPRAVVYSEGCRSGWESDPPRLALCNPPAGANHLQVLPVGIARIGRPVELRPARWRFRPAAYSGSGLASG